MSTTGSRAGGTVRTPHTVTGCADPGAARTPPTRSAAVRTRPASASRRTA
jgi:hypothetical protein